MTPNLIELADRIESFIPRGDGYNSDYANTLAEAVEVLRAKAAPAEPTELVELVEALEHVLKMQLRGFITLGNEATDKARAALAKYKGDL